MKIALIELDSSPHDVFLYSQIKFLKSKPDTYVALICSIAIQERVTYYKDMVEAIHYVKKKLRLFDILKLRSLLIKEGFTKVIFNTAHGNEIKILLSLPFPKRIEFAGILHYPDKLARSGSQKIISRKVHKYFLLIDYLRQTISNNPKLDIRSSYLIFYPELNRVPLNKDKDEIWICIPGVVEFGRRDYEGLVKAIGKGGLSPKIKFILLGSSQHKQGDGKPLKEMISHFGLDNHFKLWDGFISPEEFFSYMHECDYVMPLIHPNHESFTLYTNQTSGTFNLAFGFKKILLIEEIYSQYSDFKNNSTFYKVDNMAEVINNLGIPDTEHIYKEDKWTLDFQAKKYWELLDADKR